MEASIASRLAMQMTGRLKPTAIASSCVLWQGRKTKGFFSAGQPDLFVSLNLEVCTKTCFN